MYSGKSFFLSVSGFVLLLLTSATLCQQRFHILSFFSFITCILPICHFLQPSHISSIFLRTHIHSLFCSNMSTYICINCKSYCFFSQKRRQRAKYTSWSVDFSWMTCQWNKFFHITSYERERERASEEK